MAQRGINKVILVGNLGQDPEIRYFANGGAVANLTLATSEIWKDKQTGENKERTEWHRVAVFGKLAEIAGEYLKKGSQVYIEGQLQTRKWQDKTGNERYTTEIVVSIGGTLQILGSRSNQNQSDFKKESNDNWSTKNNTNNFNQNNDYAPMQQNEPPIEFDDDIPF